VSAVKAQDFRRYQPKHPTNTEGEARLPDEPKAPTGDSAILVDELRGIIFIDHADSMVTGTPDMAGIQVTGDSRLSLLRTNAFQRHIGGHLGQPVSLLSLNELARDVIMFFRNCDQPVVDVSIPEQDITDGIVQVVVTVARVGEVRIEGTCYFDPCFLKRQLCVHAGGRIYESRLLDDLRQINNNPFREVDMELTPGDNFGETDVVFKVREHRPVRGYLGYEDTGTRGIGIERMIFGANWGNALWRDHQMGYQYTTSGDFERLRAHSGVYSMPVNKRDTLVFYGGFADIFSPAATTMETKGTAWQSSFRYHCPLQDNDCYEHRLIGGFDFKQTNTDLEFGGTEVLNTSADIAQMVFGYHGLRTDTLGQFALGADLYISPGGFSPGNSDLAYQQLRAFAGSTYAFSRMYIERRVDLPHSLLLLARATGQVADGNLLPSEQLGFGGFNSIRGYDMRRVNGDSGYLLNFELATDPINLGLLGRCNEDEFQSLIFYDMGAALNRSLLPGEDPNVELSSVGFGFRYAMAPDVAMRFDYAWQLSDINTSGNLTSRPHIGIVISR